MSKYREIRKMHVKETEWKRKMRERGLKYFRGKLKPLILPIIEPETGASSS